MKVPQKSLELSYNKLYHFWEYTKRKLSVWYLHICVYCGIVHNIQAVEYA